MQHSIETISLAHLAIAFIPVALVIGIIWKWNVGHKNASYAVLRMLIQLLLIGYLLTFIFESDSYAMVIAILFIMISASTWIALNSINEHRKSLYLRAFYAIGIGGGLILALISVGVLNLTPWYSPSYLIPLAGMIFANSMNSVSLSAERLFSEGSRGESYESAKTIAFHAALIPVINSLFAVGLVSLPGMMTGQILSGVSPFIAARYQIMVMCMIFGSAGISAALFLIYAKPYFLKKHKISSITASNTTGNLSSATDQTEADPK